MDEIREGMDEKNMKTLEWGEGNCKWRTDLRKAKKYLHEENAGSIKLDTTHVKHTVYWAMSFDILQPMLRLWGTQATP